MVARTIAKLTAPLTRRVRLLARRAVVMLVYDDPKMQELQLAIFSGEIRDRVERWQDYGFTCHPHLGAEAIVLSLGGSSNHSAVIKVDDRRYRLKSLAQGEVALYDDQGQVIKLARDKAIEISGCDTLTAQVAVSATVTCPLITAVAETKVRLETPLLEVTGEICDNCDSNTTTMSDMRGIYNDHYHPGDSGGTTGTPNQDM